jgi:hypothetical protein
MGSPIDNTHVPCARVGLDIGGTKTAGGVVLFPGGEVLARRIIPTRPNRDGHEVLQDTLDLAVDLLRAAASMGREVEGIGAGVAELVTSDGEIASAQCTYYKNSMLGDNEFAKPLPFVTDDAGTPFAVVVIPVDDALAVKAATK